jgi:hypothetical protein
MVAHFQDVRRGSAVLTSLLGILEFIPTLILEEATRISSKLPLLLLRRHNMTVQLSPPLAR